MAHKYIGLQGIIDLLGGEKRRSGDEHICLCPAHNDRDPSLSVKEGDKGIVLHCTSRGCSTEDICAALGIRMSELFKDPLPARSGKPRTARPKAMPAEAPEERKPAKVYNSYAEAYGWLGKFVCAYPYRDSNGALKFEVARILGKDGKKTFRQHRPVKPDGSGRCSFPIRLDVPAALRDTMIYRQADIVRAVREGKTVYIVEGEKDADTMARLGLEATTNAGGGTKDKWKDGHTAFFKGAEEVIILPDNDEVGEGHAVEVYRAVAKAAKAAYIVRLRDGYPELPPKGDFTDLVEAIGEEGALYTLDKLAAAARENQWQKAMRAYADIPGYGIDNGKTCQFVEGVPKTLCNFVALPVEIVETDDGVNVEKSLRIVGWNQFGKPLKTVTVPVSKFRSMDWVLDNWDLEANIMPGNTVKDKLRWIMTEAGYKVSERKTIYSHCGWRRIDGKWVYLYQGGCIGAEGVTVDMGNDLEDYTLGNTPEISVEDAAMTSFSTTLILPAYISVPLLGITYLAPLNEFLGEALCPPSFVTALIGTQGTHKTGIASLFMNHFGRFGIRKMPANFMSTLNAVRRSAFAAKDAVLLVDDYFPATSLQERKKMEGIMQMLTRTFGDKAVRNRLNADLSMQAATPSRCVAMITGETVPDVGASGQARMYMIEMDSSSYTYSDDMDRLRQDAEDGALRKAMASYIEWLLPQADELPERMQRLFRDYRRKAHEMIAGAATNDRADDAVAHIMIGLTMMTEWLEHLGLMTEENAEAQLGEWWGVVISNARAQGAAGKEESPTSMFITAMREMIISGVVWMDDLSIGAEKRSRGKGVMCGYCDEQNYYFLSEHAMGAVNKFYNDQNRLFPLSNRALFKAMREEGVIEQWDREGNRSGRIKRVDGRNVRCIWIPRWRIDGGNKPEPPTKQLNMEGFRQVEDPDLPDQFKEE